VTSYERVDHALDVMFAADPTLTAFDRNDLATAAGCSPDYARRRVGG
jgi:hypothetical protein